MWNIPPTTKTPNPSKYSYLDSHFLAPTFICLQDSLFNPANSLNFQESFHFLSITVPSPYRSLLGHFNNLLRNYTQGRSCNVLLFLKVPFKTYFFCHSNVKETTKESSIVTDRLQPKWLIKWTQIHLMSLLIDKFVSTSNSR